MFSSFRNASSKHPSTQKNEMIDFKKKLLDENFVVSVFDIHELLRKFDVFSAGHADNTRIELFKTVFDDKLISKLQYDCGIENLGAIKKAFSELNTQGGSKHRRLRRHRNTKNASRGLGRNRRTRSWRRGTR